MAENEKAPGIIAALADAVADVLTGGKLTQLRESNTELKNSKAGYLSRNDRLNRHNTSLCESRTKAWDELELQREEVQNRGIQIDDLTRDRDTLGIDHENAKRARDEARAEAQTAAERLRLVAQEKYEFEGILRDVDFDKVLLLRHAVRLYHLMTINRMASRRAVTSRDDRITTLTNDRDLWKRAAEEAIRKRDKYQGKAADWQRRCETIHDDYMKLTGEVETRIDEVRDQATSDLEAERNKHSELYGTLQEERDRLQTEVNQLKGEVEAQDRSLGNLEGRFLIVVKEREEARDERNRLAQGAAARNRGDNSRR